MHTKADCSDTAAAASQITLKKGECTKQLTRYTKVTAITKDDTAKICGAKVTQHSDSACANADATAPIFTDRGYPAAGGVWAVGTCYYMGKSNQYFKFTGCTAANTFSMEFFADKGCTAANAATPAKADCAGSCTKKCIKYFSNSGNKYLLVDAVVHTNTVTQPSSDGLSLVAGPIVAISSLMYL